MRTYIHTFVDKRRKQRQDFFDGSEDFDADLEDDEFEDAGKEKEFESVRQPVYNRLCAYTQSCIHTIVM